MVLIITNSEAHRLASELAKITGESLTEAVVQTLRERLRRESGKREGGDLAEELMEIGRRCASQPVVDPRTPNQIIGYYEHGVHGSSPYGDRHFRPCRHPAARGRS